MWFLTFIRVCSGILSLRGVRWAYVAFVALGLLYFPLKVGFRVNPQPCECTFDVPLAIHSFSNYAHIALFTLFFVLSSAQFKMSDWTGFFWATLATIAMGALVEIAEGVTGQGHCRVRDLIPDTVGAFAGSIIVLLLRRIGWRPRPTWSLIWWKR
jgi:VanZ like protein